MAKSHALFVYIHPPKYQQKLQIMFALHIFYS